MRFQPFINIYTNLLVQKGQIDQISHPPIISIINLVFISYNLGYGYVASAKSIIGLAA